MPGLAGHERRGQNDLDQMPAGPGCAHLGHFVDLRAGPQPPAFTQTAGLRAERFSPPGWLHARDYFRLAAHLHGLAFPQPGLLGMLAELDLEEDILDRPLRECSKGMAQKIGLAAAFLARRRLLVLDEPMSGLDPLSRIRVRRQLHLQRGDGCAVLMSTHSLADVEDLADRVAILHYLGSSTLSTTWITPLDW
jgi:ABC-2 type transport system ATP-binding protein